jgi:hypothetical protein
VKRKNKLKLTKKFRLSDLWKLAKEIHEMVQNHPEVYNSTEKYFKKELDKK